MYGLLADEDRLRVVAALALGDRSVAELSRTTGAEPRAVVRALRRLQKAGVVSSAGDDWELRRDVIARRAREESSAPVPYEEHGLPSGQATVLRSFVRDGRVVRLPSMRSKRLVVLDHVARVFELGVRYPEPEVNALLHAFHADHAALRRALVDEQFLSREAGVYWRSGGSVEL